MLKSLKMNDRKKLLLNGEWCFLLDPEEKYVPTNLDPEKLCDKITVPGSWEEQGFGQPSKHQPIGTWKKSREYEGTAWYFKDIFISDDMKDKSLNLVISGARWKTKVYINNLCIDECNSLVSTHVYNVTDYINVGCSNRIAIYVNNTMILPLHDSHIHSYHTATNWGGITGGIHIEATPLVSIQTLTYYPYLEKNKIEVQVEFTNPTLLKQNDYLSIAVYTKDGNRVTHTKKSLLSNSHKVLVTLDLWDEAILWDEDHPYLYKISASIIHQETIIDHKVQSLGLRSIKTVDKNIVINQTPRFFTGYVDCCIFPKTGYPSWDKNHYLKQFKIVKEYGFNHVRLHGWTPPKPFWEAADEAGIFVQTELPHWSNLYTKRDTSPNKEVHEFLSQEIERMISSLNEHPSFVLLSLGNELISAEGHEALNEMVNKCRSLDSTRLYTDNTGFGHLPAHDREGDFYIPTLNAHPPVTNHYAGTPNTFEDYSMVTQLESKPMLAHEHGQFTMYVRPQEKDKYQGILHPHWLKTTMETLEKKRLLGRVDEFIQASGVLQARAYKESIERARRTSGLSGIQLLDIRDFPGQGHATTGVLDVFWDNKGTITPEQFRTFNDECVLLMRCKSRTHVTGEKINIVIDLSNFSKYFFEDCQLTWELKDRHGAIQQTGTLPISSAPHGEVTTIGVIEAYTQPNKSQELLLSVYVETSNRVIKNEWEFWTYARPTLHSKANQIWSDVSVLKSSIYGMKHNGKIGFQDFSYKEAKGIELAISDHMSTELLQYILDGGKAWLMAEEGNQYDEVKTRFLPIFWNYIWFPSQVGTTMGMIINEHPSLDGYPHDGTSNWNWYHLVDGATAMNLETVPQIKPIVEVIDNHNRGKHLSYCFEAKIGEGSLFVTSFNILQNLKRPEVESLLHHNIHYLMSEKFTPTAYLTVGECLGLFKLQGTW